MPDTSVYLDDPVPADGNDFRGSGGGESCQPPDDSTTFGGDYSFDDDADADDDFDPGPTIDMEHKWDWTGPSNNMCEVGCWEPGDPVHNKKRKRAFSCNSVVDGSFVVSLSNLRNDFIGPEHQNDILRCFRECFADVTGVQNATEAFARAMLEE